MVDFLPQIDSSNLKKLIIDYLPTPPPTASLPMPQQLFDIDRILNETAAELGLANISELQDQYDYSNPISDCLGVEHRIVEIPQILAAKLPLRNFTELEWRGLGIRMSKGWENYSRKPGELAVFAFRRGKIDRRADLKWMREAAFSEEYIANLPKMYNFPIFAFEPGISGDSLLRENLLKAIDEETDWKKIHTAVLDFAESCNI